MKQQYNLVYGDFYKHYITLVHDKSIRKALKKNTRDFLQLLDDIPASKIDYAYADGKWTIKQLVQHIIDAERVFSYRALRIARYDETPLAGFDENTWAERTDVSARGWKDMVREFRQLRKSNELMIDDFNIEQLNSTGTASNHPVSVAALCYIIPGHVQHHMNVLKERYLKKN